MAWNSWAIEIVLGKDTDLQNMNSRSPSYLSTVRARTEQEAEKKGCAIVHRSGLSGLLIVTRV